LFRPPTLMPPRRTRYLVIVIGSVPGHRLGTRIVADRGLRQAKPSRA
jgi:hypothetical protein